PYLTPGVYIEEVPAGSRPIQGVSTAVAAFLGMTEKCPLDASGKALIGYPLLVTSWEQYKEQFGGFLKEAITPIAVYGYFQNGGGVCYVESLAATNVASKNGKPQPKATLQLPSRAPGSPPSLELEAKVADPVDVIVSDASDPGDELFKVTVRSK